MTKIKITLGSMISIIIPTIAYGQQTQTAIRSSGPIFAEINMQDLIGSQNEMVNHVVNMNATYLGIGLAASLAIVGALSAFFYHFNLKPLIIKVEEREKEARDLKKQSEVLEGKLKSALDNLETTQKATESKFETLQNSYGEEIKKQIGILENKNVSLTGEMNKKLSRLERITDTQQVLSSWQEQYIWETKNVPQNVISTLLETLEENDYMKGKYNSSPLGDLPLDKLVNKFKEKKSLDPQFIKKITTEIKESKKLSDASKNQLLEIIKI